MPNIFNLPRNAMPPATSIIPFWNPEVQQTQNTTLPALVALVPAGPEGPPGPPGTTGETVQLSASTTDSTPVILAGMPELPNVVCAMRLVGHVTAFNILNGDAISWDIAALINRQAINAPPSIVGDASISVFAADDAMMGCTLSFGVDQIEGLLVFFTGLDTISMSVISSILFAPGPTS